MREGAGTSFKGEAMKLAELVHFPLKEAFICLESDCSCIHNSNSFCPACSSTAILPLTKWVAQIQEALPKEMK